MKDRRGSLLVLVMWALVFLSVLNVALFKMVVSHLEVTKRFRNRIISPYLAKAAYLYARTERKIDETPGYDTLYELKTERTMELDSGRYIYTLGDEGSKVNINKAARGVLSRLPGIDEDLADDILASELRPFQAIEELMLVDGMEEDIFSEIKDFVTVYGQGWININTASREVFAAFDMDDDLIRIIEEYRFGDEGSFFESNGEIVDNLNEFTGEFRSHEAKMRLLIGQGKIQVKSNVLALQVVTEVRNKPAIAYNIIMDNNTIKRWREE